MQLDQLREMYARVRLPRASRGTHRKYAASIGHFAAFLGRPPEISDFGEESVLSWVNWLIDVRGLSTDTASGYHSKILSLWKFAARKQLTDVWPEHNRIRPPDRIPIAWTQDQLRRLFLACETVSGHVGGLPANQWWQTLHACLWDTGERISAMLAVRWDWIDLDAGWLTIRAEHRKGKHADKVWQLHPDTVRSLIRFSQPRRQKIWPFPHSPATLWNRYKRILESAGLPSDRRHKFHCMRRSVASWYEAAGGNATELLGHSSRDVTRRYLDPQIIRITQASDLLFRPVG